MELSDGEIPTWQSLLGFVAWRSGEAEVAEKAFRKSIELFQQWRSEQKVANAVTSDNDGLASSSARII